MFNIKSKIAPFVFQTHFTEVHHPYPTRFSEDNFVENQIVLTQTKFVVSSQGPCLWDKMLYRQQKAIACEMSFKQWIKSSFLLLENEVFLAKIIYRSIQSKCYQLVQTSWRRSGEVLISSNLIEASSERLQNVGSTWFLITIWNAWTNCN